MKRCQTCKIEKDESEFYAKASNKDGLSSHCRLCFCSKTKEYRDRVGYHRLWAQASIKRHRQRGYESKFSIDELTTRALHTPKCELCDTKLSWYAGKKKISDDSPTVDNMHLSFELTMENIMIVCLKCNTTKRNRTFYEFLDYCS